VGLSASIRISKGRMMRSINYSTASSSGKTMSVFSSLPSRSMNTF
jgi:hypothetical protein